MSRRPQFEIKLGGRTIPLGARTVIMGVLNVTPDSFSDGGRYLDANRAIRRGVELIHHGADWLDVGGESTRPGAQPVSVDEELRRVLPVIHGLRRKLPRVPISIDTTKSAVAEQAIEAGANIVNDVSGLRFDAQLADVARTGGTPLILMHMRGTPTTMQRSPFDANIWTSLAKGLKTSIENAVCAGVRPSQLILDPGLGFGKSRRQNYEIIAGLERLRRFHLPILIGASRKSFVHAIVVGESLDPKVAARRGDNYWPIAGTASATQPVKRDDAERDAESLATGNAAIVVAAILAGAHIVRVHDPFSILPAVRVADALLAAPHRSPF